MEKRFTKLISLLLAIVMVMGMIPANVFATGQGVQPEDTDVEVPIVTTPATPEDPEEPADEEDTIVLGERFTCTIAEEGNVSQIPFTPDTTGWYMFVSYCEEDTYGSILLADGTEIISDDDGDYSMNFNVRAYLYAGTEYILQGKFWSANRTGSFEAAIYALEEIALDEMKEVTLAPSNAVRAFSFTPAESGVYSFYTCDPDRLAYELRVREAGTYRENTSYTQLQGEDFTMCQIDMEAGRSYALYISNDDAQERTPEVAVIKASINDGGIVCLTDSIDATVYSTGNLELRPGGPLVDMSAISISDFEWESGNAEIVEVFGNGNECSYTLLAAGSTEITATLGDIILTIPVTVAAIPALTLGQEVQTQAAYENDETQFVFTAPEDGVYGFYAYHEYEEPYYVGVEVNVEGDGWFGGGDYYAWGVNERQLELKAGDVCYVRLTTWYPDGLLDAYVGVVECPEVEEVVFEPASITGYVSNAYKTLYYTAYPVHANLCGMTWDSTDENVTWVNDWNNNYANYRLLSVGTATLSMTVDSNTYSVPVQVLDHPVLELDTEVEVTSQSYEDDRIYVFTAPEAGVYSFYAVCENNQPGNSMQIAVDDSRNEFHYGEYYGIWGTKDVQLEMAEGETCKVHFYSGSGNSANTSMVGVVKAPAPTSISVSKDRVVEYLEEENSWCSVQIDIQPAHADVTSIEWVSGDENVVLADGSGKWFEYQVQGLGETVVTATYGGEILAEIPVLVTQPQEIEPDVSVRLEDVVWGAPQQFTFTPTESDVYSFYSVSDDNNYRLEVYVDAEDNYYDGNWHEEWETEDVQLYMEAGKTYTLGAACYYGDRAVSGSVCLTRSPDATEIQVDVESVSVYLDNSWRSISAKAFPAHADMTALVWSSDNEDIVTVESYGHYCRYLVNEVGTANIIVTAGDASYTIPVEGKAKPVLQEGMPQSVTCVTRDDDIYFDFTPTESGVYTFYQDNLQGLNMSVYTDNWYYGQLSEAWGCEYVQKHLTAGNTYTVFIYNTWSGEEQTGNVCVVKAPAITAITATQSSISDYVGNSWIGMSLNVQPMYADISEVTVTSSNEQVVQAYYSSGQLNYQMLAEGTAEITVTAGDTVLTIPVEVKSVPTAVLDEPYTCDVTVAYENVYRNFTPQQSDYYKFYAIDDGNYIDVYGEICDENGSLVAGDDDSGGNGRFMMVAYLEAGKTYSLVARSYGAGMGSFQAVISAIEVQQLVSGEQQITFETDDPYYYAFTAETADTYVFYVNSSNVNVRTNNAYYTPGYNEVWGSQDYFVYLDAGDTCMFTLQAYETGLNTAVGMIPAVEATSISFDREQISGFAGTDGSVRISTMPAHSRVQDVTWASSDPAVIEVSGGSDSCWYWLHSVGTAQITATVGGTVYALPVTVNEIPTLAEGETVQVSLQNNVIYEEAKYKFVPAESGVYSFYAENVTAGMVNLTIQNENGSWLAGGQAYGPGFVDPAKDAQYELEAGTTYYLMASPNWEEQIACTLGIVKAPEVTGIVLDWEDGLYEYYLPGESSSYYISATTLPAHADVSGLEWTVTDEAVARISYQGSAYCDLVIAGHGTAQLVVTAGNGISASMDINIRETPEMELGEAYDCVYDENYSRFQFLFTPEVSGTYHAYTTGEGSTQIWLYELVQYEEWLETYHMGSSSYGAEGNNALMTMRLEAGKTYMYYVEEYRDVESFTFRVTDPEPVTELSFFDDTWVGFPGDWQWVNYDAKPFTADLGTVELVSSDDTVVTVQEDGSVKMVGAGTATLTATAASGVSATCAVTVKAPVELTLNSQMNATVAPELNAEKFYFIPAAAGTYVMEAKGPMGNKLLYASSENGIDVGNESRGDVKIQFTAEAGERVDIILEAYYDYPAEFTVKVTSANAATGISIAQGSAISGMVHSISKLNVNFAPVGAAEEEIYWESSDESVATVEYGYVTIVGAGTAVITAQTETGLTASCTVTGTEPATIVVDETKKVDVEVPGDTGVFKFVPENTTTYVIRSIGNAETSLEILDEDGNYVGAMNYALRAAYGITGNSGDVVELEAGKTYYVRASMASTAVGAFKVVIEEHLSVVDFEITQLPYQTECYRNGEINMSGLELKVEWSDGSFTDYSYDEGGDLGDENIGWGTSGESTGKRVSINIGSITREFTVPYAQKTVTGIRIIDNEEFCVVEYADGEWYEGEFYYYLPTELLGAEITYSDGSTKTVDSIDGPVDGAWFEGFYNAEQWEVGADDNTVTFEYLGAEAQYNVRLVASPVESITVNSAPTKVYTFGDEWYGWINDEGVYEMYGWDYDMTGLSLTVKYTDGSSNTFTHEDIEGGEYSPALYMDGFSIGFSDLEATLGKNTVTVSYLGAEATYQITVVEPTVRYVQIVKAPDVIPTEADFTSDSLGMQLKLTYTDNTTKVITVTEDNVSYSGSMYPASIITDGDVQIRVSYDRGYGQVYAYVTCGSFSSYQLIAEQNTSYTIEDIEVTKVSTEDASVELKLTYMDGTGEVLTLAPAAGAQISKGIDYFRSAASTDKGMLSYTVWMYRDNDDNVVEYEIEVMGRYFYLEAPEMPDVVVGDADGNGIVDGMDATLLLQYAAGWDVEIDEAAGDADGNGVVDGMDATLLLQYAAGWDVTLGGN